MSVVRRLLAILERVSVFKLLVPLYCLMAAVFVVLIARGNVQLLNPAGYVAGMQSKILWAAIAFAVVVGGSLIATFYIVIFRYRDTRGRRYEGGWTVGHKAQLLAWLVPTLVVVVVSYFVWDTAHLLDPYKPLAGSQPLTIQVVALRWKWLFLYPNERVATINQLVLPVNTPVSFQLTADAPMSSFWIPRLSGQVYAMTGMVTQLHLMADKLGTYPGQDVEINGDGYSGMDFTVRVVSANDFANWKNHASTAALSSLDYHDYAQLAEPTSYNQPKTYHLRDANLFDAVVMQFMEPGLNLADQTVKGERL